MTWRNPIILKELLQTSRSRRLFVLRAVLPAGAALLAAPQIAEALNRAGQDWRTLGQLGRPLFETCAWLELAAFAAIAVTGADAAIRDEWTRRTLDCLCATPMSLAAIVYGKFAALLAKVGVAALALLPVTGILYRVAQLPREIALGSVSVILGGTLLFGSLALLQAVAVVPRSRFAGGAISVLALYFGVLVLVDLLVWQGQPVLAAAVPPRALYFVLTGSPPGGWGVAGFALLSLGLSLGVSAVALGLAPLLLRWSFARHMGGRAGRRSHARWRRLLRGRRPDIADYDDPFYWQELGPRTHLVRWGLWLVYGIAAAFIVAVGIADGDFHFIHEEEFWVFLSALGIGTLGLLAAAYGTSVFAQEKPRRTAYALLLTGAGPGTFYAAKIKALYRALAWSIVWVGIVSLHMLWATHASAAAVFLTLEGVLLAPLAGVIVGMVFSAAARTPARALLGFLSTFAWAAVIACLIPTVGPGTGPGGWLCGTIIVAIAFVCVTRRWAPWRLGLLLALTICVLVCSVFAIQNSADRQDGAPEVGVILVGAFVLAMLVLGAATRHWTGRRLGLLVGLAVCLLVLAVVTLGMSADRYSAGEEFGLVVGGTLVLWALVGAWLWLGLASFEAGMRGERLPRGLWPLPPSLR